MSARARSKQGNVIIQFVALFAHIADANLIICGAVAPGWPTWRARRGIGAVMDPDLSRARGRHRRDRSMRHPTAAPMPAPTGTVACPGAAETISYTAASPVPLRGCAVMLQGSAGERGR